MSLLDLMIYIFKTFKKVQNIQVNIQFRFMLENRKEEMKNHIFSLSSNISHHLCEDALNQFTQTKMENLGSFKLNTEL